MRSCDVRWYHFLFFVSDVVNLPLGDRVARLENSSSLPAKTSPDVLSESNPSNTPAPMPLESESPLSDGEIDDNEPQRGDSPSLYDLKEAKKRLLVALDDSTVSITTLVKNPLEDDSLIDDIMALQDDTMLSENGDRSITDTPPATPTINSSIVSKSLLHASKETVCGTPVIQAVSPFSNLPNSEKWREGVTDVLDFENLPESIGKYEKMRTLLEKVRVKVKKIQYEDEEDR